MILLIYDMTRLDWKSKPGNSPAMPLWVKIWVKFSNAIIFYFRYIVIVHPMRSRALCTLTNCRSEGLRRFYEVQITLVGSWSQFYTFIHWFIHWFIDTYFLFYCVTNSDLIFSVITLLYSEKLCFSFGFSQSFWRCQ